jgi:hypothetical protein
LKKGILSILFLFVLTIAGYGQVIPAIEDALEKGNASIIESYLDTRISLTIGDQTALLKKAEVRSRLDSFFKNHKPSKYTRKHNGSDRNDQSQYVIGELKTNTGVYRVYVYVETVSTNKLIRELRLESL